jgi:DNA-binding transcriptional LysR family regulator
MSLNSDQLDAFFEVAKLGSFSKAAEELAVSQPALSQRIKKLEEALCTSLFVRDASGNNLTDMGKRLLLYCRNRRDLEAEFLQTASASKLTGVIRVAGFSSVMRSAIMPALSDLVRENSHLQIELVTREIHELPEVLRSAQSDFVITDKPISYGSVESHELGVEEYVLIESAKGADKAPDVYFDHDAEDQITFEFFKAQGRKRVSNFRRSFLDEAYALIEAVELGWGRAVVPRHMISANHKVRVMDEYTTLKSAVYLNYHSQPFYLPLHKSVSAALVSKIRLILRGESTRNGQRRS